MMRLSVKRDHKSITERESWTLPSFAAIVGINGSGKSQLLEAMDEGAIEVLIGDSVIDPEHVRLFTWATLNAGATSASDPSELTREASTNYDALREQMRVRSQSLLPILTNDTRAAELIGVDIWSFTRSRFLRNYSRSDTEQAAEDSWLVFKEQREQLVEVLERKLSGRSMMSGLFELCRNETKKELYALSRSEFIQLTMRNIETLEPFQQNLSTLFVRYQKAFNDNVLRRGLATQYDEKVGYLSDEEFTDQFGIPPWDYLNRLLEQGSYDFRINAPPPGPLDTPFLAELKHQVNGATLHFEDLSSGERILMALVMCVYASEYERIKLAPPRVMLFDEVDAPLHPSMISELLSVFRRVLVEEHDIRVLIATHSPTTAALMQEGEIFRMSKVLPRIQAVSVDEAIQSLTTGVPALTVRVEARRPVYVESNNDVALYEALSDSLRSRPGSARVPIFLSVGHEASSGEEVNAGSSRVKRVVADLTRAGVSDVYGLCDGDGQLMSSDNRVFLLGGGGRYAIENYILDPLLLACLLAIEQMSSGILPDVSESTREVWRGLDKQDPDVLHAAVDSVISYVGPPSTVSESEHASKATVTLVGGCRLEYPTWMLQENGHSWAQRVLAAIPSLNQVIHGSGGNREVKLMHAVLTKVAKRLPENLDASLLSTLERLRS